MASDPADLQLDQRYIWKVRFHVAGYVKTPCKTKTSLRQWKSLYGVNFYSVVQICLDLSRAQLTKNASLEHLFWTLSFLKTYDTEDQMAARLKMNTKTLQKYIVSFLMKLYHLKKLKVCKNCVNIWCWWFCFFLCHSHCFLPLLTFRFIGAMQNQKKLDVYHFCGWNQLSCVQNLSIW